LQHGYSICIIGQKGYVSSTSANFNKISDVIFDQRVKQSEKTNKIYALIEEFFPHSRCIELFGRYNNLQNYWFTLGNQIFEFVIFFFIVCL
jgi:N6-adenosine-specific RNA methylase IME4